MRRSLKYPTFAAACCALLLWGMAELGFISGPRRARVSAQERQWRKAGVRSYAFTYRRWCNCEGSGTAFRVVVRDGRVLSAQPQDTAGAKPEWAAVFHPTVEGLFSTLGRAAGTAGSVVSARYDPVLHYPREIHVQWQFGSPGAMDVEISELRPLAAPGRDASVHGR